MKNIKVKVTKEFTDRYTGIKHKVGEVLTITDARFREIKRSGSFVEVVNPSEVKKEKK